MFKWMKKILAVTLAAVMLIGTATSALASRGDIVDGFGENIEEIMIQEHLLNYFQALGEAHKVLDITDTNRNDLSMFYASQNIGAEEAKNKDLILLETRIGHYALQDIDLRWKDVEHKVEMLNLYQEGNYIVAETQYSHIASFEGSDFKEQGNAAHTFKLINDNGTYKIVSHEYDDDFEPVIASYLAGNETLEEHRVGFSDNDVQAWNEAKNQYLEYASSKVESNAPEPTTEELELNNAEEESSRTPQAYTFKSYQRQTARNYAVNNCRPQGNRNGKPYYHDANYYRHSVDCTNFTSRAMKAGGIVEDTTGSYQWYWISSSNKSASFTSANYFRDYYKNNYGSSTIKGLCAFTASALSSMENGDLGQTVVDDYYDSAKREMIKKATHTYMFVEYKYTKLTNGQYDWRWVVAQHQSDDFYWLSQKPATREYVRILGSYS